MFGCNILPLLPSFLPLPEALSTAVFAIPVSLSIYISQFLSVCQRKKIKKIGCLLGISCLVLFSYVWSTKSRKTFSSFICLFLVLFKHWDSFCGCEISGDFWPHVFASSLLQIVSLISLCLKSRALANLRTRSPWFLFLILFGVVFLVMFSFALCISSPSDSHCFVVGVNH